MRAIMYGFGPAFRKNYVSEPLAQVDHYNLFCHLLDIDPKPNNGSMARIERLLKEAESEEDSEESDEDESEAAEQTDDDDDDDGVTANKLHSTLIYMIVLQVFYLVINKLVWICHIMSELVTLLIIINMCHSAIHVTYAYIWSE